MQRGADELFDNSRSYRVRGCVLRRIIASGCRACIGLGGSVSFMTRTMTGILYFGSRDARSAKGGGGGSQRRGQGRRRGQILSPQPGATDDEGVIFTTNTAEEFKTDDKTDNADAGATEHAVRGDMP